MEQRNMGKKPEKLRLYPFLKRAGWQTYFDHTNYYECKRKDREATVESGFTRLISVGNRWEIDICREGEYGALAKIIEIDDHGKRYHIATGWSMRCARGGASPFQLCVLRLNYYESYTCSDHIFVGRGDESYFGFLPVQADPNAGIESWKPIDCYPDGAHVNRDELLTNEQEITHYDISGAQNRVYLENFTEICVLQGLWAVTVWEITDYLSKMQVKGLSGEEIVEIACPLRESPQRKAFFKENGEPLPGETRYFAYFEQGECKSLYASVWIPEDLENPQSLYPHAHWSKGHLLTGNFL